MAFNRPTAPAHASWLEIPGSEILVYCPGCMRIVSECWTGKPVCALDETLCDECIGDHTNGCSDCYND